MHVGEIAISPMSFIVYYDQEVSEDGKKHMAWGRGRIEVKDDLGNMYSGEGNGGKGCGL